MPLSAAALALLEARMPIAPNALVFPSRTNKPFGSIQQSSQADTVKNRQKRSRLGRALRSGTTSGARSSRTWPSAAMTSICSISVWGTREGVFGIYQRASRMAERARALEAWAGLIAGEGIEQTGKVVPLRASGVA